MPTQKSRQLQTYNTFALSCEASNYISIASVDDLVSLPVSSRSDAVILGGGSNILLPPTISRPVLHMQIRGISMQKQDDSVLVTAGAGEDWDAFVQWTLTNQAYGLENLAKIPGSVGACPVQNIGAYGKQVEQYIDSVHVCHKKTSELLTLSRQDCLF